VEAHLFYFVDDDFFFQGNERLDFLSDDAAALDWDSNLGVFFIEIYALSCFREQESEVGARWACSDDSDHEAGRIKDFKKFGNKRRL